MRHAVQVMHGRNHRPGGSDPIGLMDARMPWIFLERGLDGETAEAGVDYYPPYEILYTSPLNAGGAINAGVYAPTDPLTGPWSEVQILEPGLYLAEFRCNWFLDWDAARVSVTHHQNVGDPAGSVLSFRNSLISGEQAYLGFGGLGAGQYTLTQTQIFAVDERATDVTIDGFLNNDAAGADRTFDDGATPARVGGATLFVLRLSPSSHSYPR